MSNTQTAAKVAAKQEITCNFCGQRESVFRVKNSEELEFKCSQCNARYFKTYKPGITPKQQIVIQDLAAMYNDSSWGCHIVFAAQGDISKKVAKSFKKGRELKPMKGFDSLSPDFVSLLWCTAGGTPKLDEEIITEACVRHARQFTARNDRDSITALTFGNKITHLMNSKELSMVHDLIGKIPMNNDNLIRYYIAEGQELLILKAARKALEEYRNNGNLFGVMLVSSMCV